MPFAVPDIPSPRLKHVDNRTPFAIFQCDKMAPGRRFCDTVVVKGVLELTEGVLRLPGPGPIVLGDDYFDPTNAERSSLKRPGDALLTKPGTDVIVTGAAKAPHGRPTRQWDATVIVRRGGQTALRHTVQATGPRAWQHLWLRGWSLSRPEPTLSVPIRYELAYGGSYFDHSKGKTGAWVMHEGNPSGRGLCDAAALDKHASYDAPAWQLPAHPVTSPNRDSPLAGFGPVARPWISRRRYAGTYDETWERKMRDDLTRGLPPDYAPDLDLRFFQCAHPALTSARHLRGDEQLGLVGLLGHAPSFVTRLPGISVLAKLRQSSGDREELALPLDTVHIDLDARRVYLAWRLCVDQARGIEEAVLTTRGGSLA